MNQPSVERAEEWDLLSRYARTYDGRPVEWTKLVAQMLAAARMFESAGTMQELRGSQEWTTKDWLRLLERAEEIWRRRQKPASVQHAVSPFTDGNETTVVRPGQFEVLRQLCLQLIDRRNLFGNPETLVGMMLELAQRAGGGRGGEYSLPPQTSDLLALLTNAEVGERALCAFSGAGDAAIRLGLRGLEVILQVPQATAASFWACLAAAANLPVWVLECDPFEELARDWGAPASFDVAVVVPPWGQKMADRALAPPGSGLGPPPPTTEAWGTTLAAVRARRVGVCLVPNGFLFKSSALDQQFKDKAIHRYGLRTVVSLPLGAAGAGVASAALVFQPHWPSPELLMVDHSQGKQGRRELNGDDVQQIAALVQRRQNGGSSRLVSFEELAGQQVNLSPERYVLSPEEARLHHFVDSGPSLPLEELADIYRPQATTGPDWVSEPSADGPVVKEVSVSDLNEVGLASAPSKRLSVSRTDFYKLRKAELRPGDVLLVTKGSVGRVGYVGHVPPDELWVANQSFAILRLRREDPLQDSRVLFSFLSSQVGQALIQRLRVGATIPGLQMGDVKRLPILVPAIADQPQIVEGVEGLFALQSQISALRGQLEERRLTMWPEGGLGEATGR